jgi:COMPASS component SWD3
MVRIIFPCGFDNLIGCLGVVVAVATHPQQNMIASGSIEPDLTVRIWSDRGST